jgi:hypothetical protein
MIKLLSASAEALSVAFQDLKRSKKVIDLRPHNDTARLMEEAKDWAATCSQLREENARLRADVARLDNLQEFWHGCVVLARRQLEEASQRLDKWMKERPTNDQ